MIVWRDKFRAFGIHFLATLLLALLASGLIFLVWFPDPFHEMAGGFRLFLLVTGCDIVLGPLISLVVYDRRKTRRALLVDYSVIAVLQLGALIYGIYNVWEARPVYLVFAKDQIEVVSAGEIAPEDLAEAKRPEYQALPMWGPRFVATSVPATDRTDALFTALQGKDVSFRPKFYVEYESQLEDIRRMSKPLSEITAKHPDLASVLDEAVRASGKDAQQLRWLSVKHRKGFWTALIDVKSGYPVGYLSADAY